MDFWLCSIVEFVPSQACATLTPFPNSIVYYIPVYFRPQPAVGSCVWHLTANICMLPTTQSTSHGRATEHVQHCSEPQRNEPQLSEQRDPGAAQGSPKDTS